MATRPARPRPAPVLRRDRRTGCSAASAPASRAHLGVDPLHRARRFVAAATAGGVGVAIYLLALGAAPGRAAPARRRCAACARAAARSRSRSAPALLLLASCSRCASSASGSPTRSSGRSCSSPRAAALLWRQSLGGGPARRAAPARAPGRAPRRAARRPRRPTRRRIEARLAHRPRRSRSSSPPGLAFLQATGALSAARDVVLAAVAVAVVLGVIFAPWIVRLVRSLTAERAERIRSQERAEMAAHLHDSVLQTLALVQQRADDPRAVAALARRQERELRAWLAGRAPGRGASTPRWRAALEAAAERGRATPTASPVEVVAVGDADARRAPARRSSPPRARRWSTPRSSAAARRSTSTPRSRDERAAGLRPRPRPGLRPRRRAAPTAAACASRSSGAWRRHGGRAEIHPAPGAGTEVELALPRSAP